MSANDAVSVDEVHTHARPVVRPGTPEWKSLLEKIADGASDRERDKVAPFDLIALVKADERLGQFLDLGGKFVVESVTPESLDEIAANHDLTLVATGKGGLSNLFPVDESRSPYDAPQRKVLALSVQGLGYGTEVFAHRGPEGGKHALFSIIAEQGEVYFGPYLHKDAGPTWSFLGWARPGSDWASRFEAAHDPASTHQVFLDLFRDYIDWDLPEVSATKIIESDPHSWLKGAVRPVVRQGVGYTASGHPVAALGDTAVAYDPIAGQGAQGGLIQAARLVAAAKGHTGEFDAAWIAKVYDDFLGVRVDGANKVTQIFLQDPVTADLAGVWFPAAAAHQGFANALVSSLSSPTPLLGFNTTAEAEGLVEAVTGEKAADVLARFTPAGRFSRSEFVATQSRARRAVDRVKGLLAGNRG